MELSTEQNSSSDLERYPIKFAGEAGEYFRIWIVNMFLTVVTLGIYGAWAKIRTRRYFYAHTIIDGHPFDYLADPVSILKGHLIVGMVFVSFALSENFLTPTYKLIVMVLFYLVLPFLIYKSICFYTHNSSYRNIRFHFDGSLWESYQLFLLLPVLIPITLGLYFPYWSYLKKRWFFENSAFGTTYNKFTGKAKPFYRMYGLVFLQVLLMVTVIFLLAFISAALAGLSFRNPSQSPGNHFYEGFILVAGLYILMICGFSLIQQYLFVRMTNYCWQESRIGDVTIKSRLKVQQLFWISLSNIAAIVFSIGLLIPWAKIRRARYVLSCMTVETNVSLDDFTSNHAADVTAIGDAATDFFDFDIGL